MSIEMMEEFFLHTDISMEDIDGKDTISFEYGDTQCVLESMSDSICVIIENEKIETDDVMEAVQFFNDYFGIDDKEKAIRELESELRLKFGR